MEELDQKIRDILTQDIELSEKYKKTVRKTLKEHNKKERTLSNKIVKFSIATCCCTIIATSVVFAKDISVYLQQLFNNNSKGLDTAIENGYIYQPNMEYIQSNNVETKIDNLIMDDFNLSFTLNFKFKDEIEVNKISDLYLPDMIIVDEENKIIYCEDENMFNQYCKENNLSLQYKNFNDDNMNSGSNWSIKEKNLQSNSINLVYNLYANHFPKSKKLTLYFNKIEIEKNENSKNKLIINGNWRINTNIPEIFYNRNAIVYNMKTCTNPKINVTEAIVYDTCMKFSLNTQEELIYKPEDTEEIINQKISEKVDEARDEYLRNLREGKNENRSIFNSDPYVQTSNGEKFYPTKNSSEDSGSSNDFMSGIVTYWQTFNLTKYETSPNLKVYLKYKGEDIIIELERKN